MVLCYACMHVGDTLSRSMMLLLGIQPSSPIDHYTLILQYPIPTWALEWWYQTVKKTCGFFYDLFHWISGLQQLLSFYGRVVLYGYSSIPTTMNFKVHYLTKLELHYGFPSPLSFLPKVSTFIFSFFSHYLLFKFNFIWIYMFILELDNIPEIIKTTFYLKTMS